MTAPAPPASATPVFRFAPSPNGYLHRGHALSALLNGRAAEVHGGRFLLRIEDIDRTRARPEFEAAIYEDLAWLGLSWETPVFRQSERFEVYREALGELDRLGLLYPAFLTRAEIAASMAERGAGWPRDPDGAPLYPGEERDWSMARRKAEMAGGKPYALRLDMARALESQSAVSWREVDPFSGATDPRTGNPASWGDVVLARKEVPASYHLAVVVDDAAQNVTHVMRGMDLEPATSVHRLLQTLLRLPQPAYFHHRLIFDERGDKLSKSRGSETIRDKRLAGERPEQLTAALGF
jgi:glutamyl-Q tRNA(Asp) synthetase